LVVVLLPLWPSESSSDTGESLSAVQGGVPAQSGSIQATPSPLSTPGAGSSPKPTVPPTERSPASTATAEPAPSPSTPPAEEFREGPAPNGAIVDVPIEPDGEETAPQTLEDLILATESSDWKTRWDAVNELGVLKDPEAIPSLAARALYDENNHPRWRSLWALASVNSGGADVIHLLEVGLEDPDVQIVRNAAVALAFFSQPQARPELIRGLYGPDSYRRGEAIFSLRNFADSEVVAALVPLLDGAADPDTRVRGEVALNLGRNGGEGVARVLLDALAGAPSSQVRWRSAMSLGWLGDPSVVAEMERLLLSEEDSQALDFIEEAIKKLQA